MAKKKKPKQKLLVVFDTSVLFNSVAYNLVRSEVRKLIETNSKHSDLNVEWYFPNIVIDERRYQMQDKAFKLLPSIEKLEKLLGHNLNITEEILVDQVDKAISKQLKELGISTLNIDTAKVDWQTLISRAVYRHLPFEPGEKEKGFRDSVIAQTFLQLVQASPNTPSVCRLAVVTNDGSLAEYITEITKEAKNVRVLSKISELEGLINTLVSEVTEEYVEKLKDKAEKFFFEEKNKEGLYYKEDIGSKINTSYKNELNSIPKSATRRQNGTWWINPPVFIKKDRQRIFYTNQILVDAELFNFESTQQVLFNPSSSTLADIILGKGVGQYTPQNLGLYQNKPGAISPSMLDFELPNPQQSFPGIASNTSKEVKVNTGQSIFEIDWSVNITPNKKLTHPRIEEIRFVTTKWNEKN